MIAGPASGPGPEARKMDKEALATAIREGDFQVRRGAPGRWRRPAKERRVRRLGMAVRSGRVAVRRARRLQVRGRSTLSLARA